MDSTASTLLVASPDSPPPPSLFLESVLPCLRELWQTVSSFLQGSITPQGLREFEVRLQEQIREQGRRILEWTLSRIEPANPKDMQQQVRFEGEVYRRKQRSPRRGGVATLFGRVHLQRVLYQPFTPGEPSIFPLEINLGIDAGGATPAFALRASRLAADLTQQQTRDVLRNEHGVSWSVDTLRKCVHAISESLGPQRHALQAKRVLELLDQANRSSGSRKIVLSVGRDGVFVPIRESNSYQEAAAATLAVFDRKGKRLGTVYLGRMPESGQGTLTSQLTRLLQEVLGQWEGPEPRLCYVTDAGHHSTEYFDRVLRTMPHPRTGKPSRWEWIVDYYHACLYITKLAEAIWGAGEEATAWAGKMRRWLRDKPNGAYRVLHSAAAMRKRHGLRGPTPQYKDAYRYLSERRHFMDYVDCRRRGLPIGSGITEAACKTMVTYRFKQSGMKWSLDGGQTILDLRLLKLSRVWEPATSTHLNSRPTISLHPPTDKPIPEIPVAIAA